MIHGGRFGRWGGFQRFGRLREVFHFGLLDIGPITRNPLMSRAYLVPIPRHPTTPWGKHAPKATDPDKVFPVIFPTPITGHPDDILPRGFVIGRQLFHQLRWLPGHDQSRARVEADRLGERFVDRAARQHLRIAFLRRRRGRGVLALHAMGEHHSQK